MASLEQFLSSAWNKPFHNESKFDEIIGHDDIKTIFNKALISKRPVHILLVGKPGTAKTMFLREIMRNYRTSYFVVGSNTTKAGLVNQLFERRPKFLLVDELEKMTVTDQTALLHLMETGIISETKIRKSRQTELTSWVFATANSCNKIVTPLLSRFVVLQVPTYTFEEFNEIAVGMLTKEKVDKNTAGIISQKVWNELGTKDIRDVIKIARLAKTPEDMSALIRLMKEQHQLF
jgi:MoxR-like ATPase